VESGHANAIVVSKLDRISRSLIDFASLMERSRRKGWDLVALDLAVDTSTPQGEMVANVMATFAQFERRLIGLRTKEGLAVKKSQGVQLGRPRQVGDAAIAEILRLRHQGCSYDEIAARLQADRIDTPRG